MSPTGRYHRIDCPDVLSRRRPRRFPRVRPHRTRRRGLLTRGAGLSTAEATLMSATVLAGAAQGIAVELWDYPIPVVALVVTTFIVNLRYVLMDASLRPWFRNLTPRLVDGDPATWVATGAVIVIAYKTDNVRLSLLVGFVVVLVLRGQASVLL